MFPGLDDALARSLRAGELLLKNEQAELEKVREYASQAQATTHAFRRGETPCGEEREACRKCYEENAADTLRCGAEVAAYDACARAASEAFVGEGLSGESRRERGSRRVTLMTPLGEHASRRRSGTWGDAGWSEGARGEGVRGRCDSARACIDSSRESLERSRARRRGQQLAVFVALADDAPVSRISEIEGELRLRLPACAP